ncbi:MAG: hypothetical protein FD144_2610 [Rhodospirillaceae bacterium]|nr:MAG: hypothetical protein FD144_2610 [Rhodospirillaceae bacterium]
MSDRLDIRYLNCRLALDFIDRHGRPPRKATLTWERIFNALHRTHSLSTIRAIDSLLGEYPTDAALRRELERLRRAIDEPQTTRVEVVEMRPLP